MGELQSKGLMGSTNRKVSHDGDVCFETEMEQMLGNSSSNTQFSLSRCPDTVPKCRVEAVVWLVL